MQPRELDIGLGSFAWSDGELKRWRDADGQSRWCRGLLRWMINEALPEKHILNSSKFYVLNPSEGSLQFLVQHLLGILKRWAPFNGFSHWGDIAIWAWTSLDRVRVMEGWDLGMVWARGCAQKWRAPQIAAHGESSFKKGSESRFRLIRNLKCSAAFFWLSLGPNRCLSSDVNFQLCSLRVGKYQSCRSFCVLPIVTNQSWQIWEVPKFGTSIFDRTFSQFCWTKRLR